MKIYRCIFSNAEILSDVYPIEEVDDVYYKVKGHLNKEVIKGEYDIGGNKSEEAPEEEAEDTVKSGCNVVLSHKLQETGFGTKKEMQTCMKTYVKRLLKHLTENHPEKVDSFKANAPKYMKFLTDNYKEMRFYTNEEYDQEALVIALRQTPGDDSGNTQELFYWKDGLEEEKC